MAENTFNVGRDGYKITIFDSAGGQVSFNGLTSFDEKPQYAKLESTGVDGNTRFRALPKGHTGTFKFDREDSNVQDYFADKEAKFFAGLPPDDVVITHTITELDQSVSQYQYQGVSLTLDDAGTWEGLGKVPQSIGFSASRLIKVA